jgi:hypothetical protein
MDVASRLKHLRNTNVSPKAITQCLRDRGLKRYTTTLRLTGIIATLLLVGASNRASAQLGSECKTEGYQFSEIQWVSSFPTSDAADIKIQTLSQPKNSNTVIPIKYCCTQTAKPNTVKLSCHIPQLPIGATSLPPAVSRLCSQPGASFVVGYSWTCIEPGYH